MFSRGKYSERSKGPKREKKSMTDLYLFYIYITQKNIWKNIHQSINGSYLSW